MIDKPRIKTILYCTDLGKHTTPVFMHALAQAENNNARIIILHVVEPMSGTPKAVLEIYMPDIEIKKIQKDGMKKVFNNMKKRVDNFLEDECGGGKERELVKEIRVMAGKPSEEILLVAEEQDIDLIVLGKSSNKVRGTRVMGSTTRRVNRLSKVPVMVVPNR